MLQDRAKVGAKRRPPSRASRRSAALSPDNSNPLEGVTSTQAAPGPASPDSDLDLDFSRIPPPVTGKCSHVVYVTVLNTCRGGPFCGKGGVPTDGECYDEREIIL